MVVQFALFLLAYAVLLLVTLAEEFKHSPHALQQLCCWIQETKIIRNLLTLTAIALNFGIASSDVVSLCRPFLLCPRSLEDPCAKGSAQSHGTSEHFFADLGLWMIWTDSVKRNGLRFLSLYSTILLDVTGEDSVLLYWNREVVQSIKCTHGFVKNSYFFMRDLLQLKVGCFNFFSQLNH